MFVKARSFVTLSYACAVVTGGCAITLLILIGLRALSIPAEQITPLSEILGRVLNQIAWNLPLLYWIWSLLPDPRDQLLMFAIPILGLFGLAYLTRSLVDHAQTGQEIVRELRKARRKARIEGKRAGYGQRIGDVTAGRDVHIQQQIALQTERLKEWSEGFWVKLGTGVAVSVVAGLVMAFIKRAFAS